VGSFPCLPAIAFLSSEALAKDKASEGALTKVDCFEDLCAVFEVFANHNHFLILNSVISEKQKVISNFRSLIASLLLAYFLLLISHQCCRQYNTFLERKKGKNVVKTLPTLLKT